MKIIQIKIHFRVLIAVDAYVDKDEVNRINVEVDLCLPCSCMLVCRKKNKKNKQTILVYVVYVCAVCGVLYT